MKTENKHRRRPGGVLSLIHDPAGPQRDADTAIPGRPAVRERPGQESGHGVCGYVFSVYRRWKIAVRRPLGNGYHRRSFDRRCPFSAISLRCRADGTAQGGSGREFGKSHRGLKNSRPAIPEELGEARDFPGTAYSGKNELRRIREVHCNALVGLPFC